MKGKDVETDIDIEKFKAGLTEGEKSLHYVHQFTHKTVYIHVCHPYRW